MVQVSDEAIQKMKNPIHSCYKHSLLGEDVMNWLLEKTEIPTFAIHDSLLLLAEGHNWR